MTDLKSRNQSLDVLRGVAILLVLGRHGPDYFHAWHRFGLMGVDLFFTLSGFLIAGLLFAEYKLYGRIDLKRFFIRRGFKIYPAYYVFLLLLLPFTVHRLRLADFVFLQSYLPHFWGHAWSLAIEEHFYLALPLLLILSLKMKPQNDFSWIPYSYPLIAFACLAVRFHGGTSSTNWSHARADALFLGVALAWFYHFYPNRLRVTYGARLLLLAFPLLWPSFVYDWKSPFAATWMLLLRSLGFGCILVWGINSSWLGKLKPVAKIGFYSYSIYLWHWPVATFFESVDPSLFWFVLYVAVSCAVGIAMAKLIEVPMLKVRDRYFHSRTINGQVNKIPFVPRIPTLAGIAEENG